MTVTLPAEEHSGTRRRVAGRDRGRGRRPRRARRPRGRRRRRRSRCRLPVHGHAGGGPRGRERRSRPRRRARARGRVRDPPLAPGGGALGAGRTALPSTEAQHEAEHERLEQDEAVESEELGEALWEVRIEFDSHRDAVAMADRIESEADDLLSGYTVSVVRHWRYLLIGADNEDQAHEIAEAVRDELPPGAELKVEAERGARLAGGEAEPVRRARRARDLAAEPQSPERPDHDAPVLATDEDVARAAARPSARARPRVDHVPGTSGRPRLQGSDAPLTGRPERHGIRHRADRRSRAGQDRTLRAGRSPGWSSRFGWLVVPALCVAAFAAWKGLPGISTLPTSGVQALLPRETSAGKAELEADRLFGSALLPRIAVVQRNPDGLPLRRAAADRRTRDPARPRQAPRLPRRVARASVRERVRGRPRVARARHDGDHLPRLSVRAHAQPAGRARPALRARGLGTGSARRRNRVHPGVDRPVGRDRRWAGLGGDRGDPRRRGDPRPVSAVAGRTRWSRSARRDSRTCSPST